MSAPRNLRILLVDDMPSIHEDFRKILAPPVIITDMDADEALLFGEPTCVASVCFEMDSAHQGLEALEKVRAAQLVGAQCSGSYPDRQTVL